MDIFLTEKSLLQNFPSLFGGHQCEIIAKLLYLLLSDGKDCKNISFALFVKTFLPLLVIYSLYINMYYRVITKRNETGSYSI